MGHDAHGSVVRSWLLDLAELALADREGFSQIKGYVEDSGEGRWTVTEAIDRGVSLPVITASLFARFSSRQPDSYSARIIAALRNQFGGHAVTSAAGSTDKGADSPGADAAAPVDAEPDVSEGEVRGAPGTPPEA